MNDAPAAGKYRLAENSPCINAGFNWITNSFDLEGGPRTRYQFIDISAYERVFDPTLYNFR